MNNNLLDAFKPETTTVWSFPTRGNWATHNPKYRGNFAPQIPRNVILEYSGEGDLVLDPMVGSGTTLIECKLLGRNGIGIDVNPAAVELTKQALRFDWVTNSSQDVRVGDVRSLEGIGDSSVDLICTHPPYLDLVEYSKGEIGADLSNISNPQVFCDQLQLGAREMFRVLKPDHYCAVLIGDTRRGQHYLPLSYMVLVKFLQVGFALKEDIIKVQHNCIRSERWKAPAKRYKFYLIMHEHLFVFRKPAAGENVGRIRWSMIPPGRQGLIQ